MTVECFICRPTWYMSLPLPRSITFKSTMRCQRAKKRVYFLFCYHFICMVLCNFCGNRFDSDNNHHYVNFKIAFTSTIPHRDGVFPENKNSHDKSKREKQKEEKKTMMMMMLFLPYIVLIHKHHNDTCLRLIVQSFNDAIEIVGFRMPRYFLRNGNANTQSVSSLYKWCNAL